MRKIKFIFAFCLLIALLPAVLRAGTYALVDGQEVSGDPISFDQKGVVLKAGSKVLDRMPWAKFTQDSLKQLRDEAKTEKDKSFIEPLIEEDVQQKAKAKELNVKPVEHLERPTGKTGFTTLFTSPLGLFILFLVYGATIYAGYEVARFKGMSPALPCGLAAIPFLGFLSPIIFLFVQPKSHAAVAHAHHAAAEEAQQHEATHYEPAAPESPHAEPQQAAPTAPHYQAPQPQAPAAPQVPQKPAAAPNVVTFRRGEFTFNRRFFETRFAGFLRAVPGEAEKDSVIYVKSLRGEFVARKITSVTQTDVVFQISKGEATADETIPFSEVSEIQIRPKDMV